MRMNMLRQAMQSREFLELAHQRDASVLKAVLEKEGLSEGRAHKEDSPAKLRNQLIVGIAANMIAEAMGQRCVIATARIRAGLKGNLLHPIATRPSALNAFFLD